MKLRRSPFLLLGFAVSLLGMTESARAADWPQWAGPNRDFRASVADDLPTTWPETGLKEIWRKPLGLGYSSIAVVSGRLYTMDRQDDVERILCLSAETGDILWTFKYSAPHLDDMRLGYGTGPHATPLLVGGRLFVAGTTGVLHALSAADGTLLWKKDLWGELEGTFLVRGYASSSIAYENNVITLVGGENRGFVAFDQESGEERWRGTTFNSSQSSPVLVNVGSEAEPDRILVAFVNNEIVAADPKSGKELWRIEHKSGAAYNITTPIFDTEKKHIFVSSAYGGGTRGLKISREGAEQLWHSRRMKIQYTNIVLVDGHIYGTTGNVGTVILAAVDAADGKVLWKDRKINRSQLILLKGDQALALADDGELSLIRLAPSGAQILAQVNVGESKTWTPPTPVGDRIYLRTESSIMALSLR